MKIGSAVIAHVVESISPASRAHVAGATMKLAHTNLPQVQAVAAAVAAAQHSATIKADHLMLVIVAGDHGIAEPGVDLGAHHPTLVAAASIAAGEGAVCRLAQSADASVLVINAGLAASISEAGESIVSLGGGITSTFENGAFSLTRVDVVMLIESGIALMLSLREQGCDVVGLGSLGLGAEESAAAIVGALTAAPFTCEDADLQSFAALGREFAQQADAPLVLDIAERFAGRETMVMVGLILCAASMNVPIIIDDTSTIAAAAIAAQLAPTVTGYLIAAHIAKPAQRQMLQLLGLNPLFASVLGHGEGAASAMTLGLVKLAAKLQA
jgi:nicotinate-nucleotide--dimethylbenzimidazole phosphoribosyltransferase